MWDKLLTLALVVNAHYVTIAEGEKFTTSSRPGMEYKIQELETCPPDALKSYQKGDLEFTAKILHEVLQENYGRNLIISGSSILYLLGQLQLVADKCAAEEIQRALNLNIDQMSCFLPEFYNNLTKPNYVIEYDMFTSLIADNNCSFTDKLKSLLLNVFQTVPFQCDFRNPLSARMINDEIAMRTNNHIKNFLTSGILSSFTNLILVDAQSFRGQWQRCFRSTDTTEMEFYGINGRITKKPIMYQSGRFLYTQSFLLGCKVLRMNYKDDEFSLVIFLPNLANGVSELIKKLSSSNSVLKTLNNLRYVNMDIYLPRFQISSASRLKVPVMKANVDVIFNANYSGLQHVASCTAPFVSDILQKITLTVDENGGGNNDDDIIEFSSNENYGTEQRSYEFKANRPFVFYLLKEEVVLFAGIHSY